MSTVSGAAKAKRREILHTTEYKPLELTNSACKKGKSRVTSVGIKQSSNLVFSLQFFLLPQLPGMGST